MQVPVPVLERAFALAQSGSCRTVAEIIKRMKAEGYVRIEYVMEGRALSKQLRALCDQACGSSVEGPKKIAAPAKRKLGRSPGKASTEGVL